MKPTVRKFRPAIIRVHRYVGLLIATFLFFAALTGCVSVFKNELDAWANPWLFKASPPSPGAARLDLLELRRRVEAQLPEGMDLFEVRLTPPPPGYSVRWSVVSREEGERTADEVFADPFTGKVIGYRRATDITESWRNLFNFIFVLHLNLGLGEVGAWILGITALLWTFDCFAALYLTFPPREPAGLERERRRPWAARWKSSWLMRATSMFTAVFTFHRAAGLWIWPVLLMFAWSSVAMLMAPVYNTAMRVVFPRYTYREYPMIAIPRWDPAISWDEALVLAKQRMEEQSARHGFTIVRPFIFAHEPDFGIYTYRVQSSLDINTHWCDTTVRIDSDTGELRDFSTPTGRDAGKTFRHWLYLLHFGWVGGLPYRIFIFLVGLITAALCVTGVIIWWRKSRRLRKGGRQSVRIPFSASPMECGPDQPPAPRR